MLANPLLESTVLAALHPLLGHRLVGVRYWCLRGETTAEAALAPLFCHGGNVELTFDWPTSVLVSWDENAGWPDHFSVGAYPIGDPARLQEHYEVFDVTESPVWRAHIGIPLSTLTVLGWNHTPQVVVFAFGAGDVAVGSGYQDRFGDGDDVIIQAGRAFRDDPANADAEVVWVSPSAG